MPQNATLPEDELSEKQVLAIPHLVSAKSVSEADELGGVNRKTIYRWMDDPAFREEYDRQRDAITEFARDGMRALMLKALTIQAQRLGLRRPQGARQSRQGNHRLRLKDGHEPREPGARQPPAPPHLQ